jgi:hypothetical protein
MAVNENMTYRLADKFWFPGSGLNRVTFVLKRLIPCSPRFDRLRIYPPAEFPWSNPEDLTGSFLGNALGNSIVYDSNHGSFYLLF